MNDPSDQIWDHRLENDRHGELYVTMDTEEYIPPPKGYKPIQKQNRPFDY